MITAFLIAALIGAAVLPIIVPLFRGSARRSDDGMRERAVFRDQLREVETEFERGLLTETEFAVARVEIQRRLLTAGDAEQPPVSPPSRAPRLAIMMSLLIVAGALGTYFMIGQPVPISANDPEAPEKKVATQAADELRRDPTDEKALTAYAQSMMRLRRLGDAETAWRRLMEAGQPSPEAASALGETLVLREGGEVGAEALGLFQQALLDDPRNEVARYYLALATFQGGKPAEALAQWQALRDDLPPDAPGRADVTRGMEAAARASGLPMPQAQDGGANRMAMIEGMVEKLAARLAEKPDDPEGWVRLGRSYAVLGRRDAAADAYEKAAGLEGDDPALQLAAAEALLAGLRPEDALPPRAIALLRQVETKLPNTPAVLWYLGLLAARDKQFDQAREYWVRLTKILPPDGDDAKMVNAAIAALSR